MTQTDHADQSQGPQPIGGHADQGTQTADQTPALQEKIFTQEDLERKLAHIVAKERSSAEQRVQAERDAIAQEKLRAQQEWQKLAEQHESQLKDIKPQLESLQAAVQARDELLLKTVKSETKEWPPEAKALIPGDADALAQMAAVDKARPLVAKLNEAGQQQQGQQQSTTPGRPAGNTPGPRPAGEPNKTLVERELERLRATGVYGNRGTR